MNRREMILTLASAALIPSTRLFANGGFDSHGRLNCDKDFAQMITDLELESWHICAAPLKPEHDRLKIFKALYSDDLFEILGNGSFADYSNCMENVTSGLFVVDPNFKFWDDFVVRTSETSALIFYRMIVSWTWGTPDDLYAETDDIWVTSSYAKIKGRWKACCYHETYSAPE
jgi:hypothetical protein